MKPSKRNAHKNLDIVRENYTLAMTYLEELFFLCMSQSDRKSWDRRDGLGPLIRFYSKLIQILPYDCTRRFHKVCLNHGKSLSLQYSNLSKLQWIVEYKDSENQADNSINQGGKMKSSEIIQFYPLEVKDNYLPKVTSDYGTRVLHGREEFHHGVDMVISHNDKSLTGPVCSCFDKAVIVFSGPYGTAGNTVILMDLENSTKLRRVLACYCHLEHIYDNTGDIVTRNERIGYMGGSGLSENQYTPHLHFSFHILEKDIPVQKAISGYDARNPFDFGLQNLAFVQEKPEHNKNNLLEELSKTNGIY